MVLDFDADVEDFGVELFPTEAADFVAGEALVMAGDDLTVIGEALPEACVLDTAGEDFVITVDLVKAGDDLMDPVLFLVVGLGLS